MSKVATQTASVAAGHHNLPWIAASGVSSEPDHSVYRQPCGDRQHPGLFCPSNFHLLHDLHPHPGLDQTATAAVAPAGLYFLLAQVSLCHHQEAEGSPLEGRPPQVRKKRECPFLLGVISVEHQCQSPKVVELWMANDSIASLKLLLASARHADVLRICGVRNLECRLAHTGLLLCSSIVHLHASRVPKATYETFNTVTSHLSLDEPPIDV